MHDPYFSFKEIFWNTFIGIIEKLYSRAFYSKVDLTKLTRNPNWTTWIYTWLDIQNIFAWK